MGEKDKAERMLESFPDVFADIINVLMFGGKHLVLPEELEVLDARSQFRTTKGELREQERDIGGGTEHLASVCLFLRSCVPLSMTVKYTSVKSAI